jgi:putative spermidine/putrescine transport system permease protein
LTSLGLAALTALVLAFLVAPILIIVPLSFSSGSFFYYPLPGFSLRWYETSSRRRSGCARSGTA